MGVVTTEDGNEYSRITAQLFRRDLGNVSHLGVGQQQSLRTHVCLISPGHLALVSHPTPAERPPRIQLCSLWYVCAALSHRVTIDALPLIRAEDMTVQIKFRNSTAQLVIP